MQILKDRLSYDFFNLINELSFLADEFNRDVLDISEITSLLHANFRIWGVCAEHAFKLVLIYNNQSIFADTKQSSPNKTISCQNAFAKCLQLKNILILKDHVTDINELIKLRNHSQHYAIEFSENLVLLLYKLVRGIDIIANLAQSELNLKLVDRNSTSGDIHVFNTLCNEIDEGPTSAKLKARLHKQNGGKIIVCYVCNERAILIPTEGHVIKCICCHHKIEYLKCEVRKCRNHIWRKTRLYHFCNIHEEELWSAIQADPIFSKKLRALQ